MQSPGMASPVKRRFGESHGVNKMMLLQYFYVGTYMTRSRADQDQLAACAGENCEHMICDVTRELCPCTASRPVNLSPRRSRLVVVRTSPSREILQFDVLTGDI
jgi:hypothetical protein